MSRGQRGSGKGRRRAFVHRRRGGKGGGTGPPTAATMLVNVEEANVDRRYIYIYLPKGAESEGRGGRWVIDGLCRCGYERQLAGQLVSVLEPKSLLIEM